MKEVDFDGGNLSESVDFRFLDSASSSQIEAACLYEYMRESKTLREVVSPPTEAERRGKPSPELGSSFFLGFTEDQFFRLLRELQSAGFPKPWKAIIESKTQLVSLLAKSKARTLPKDAAVYPPVVIEDVAVGEMPDGQLEVSPPILLKKWKRPGRRYVYGIIRFDRAYNETEAAKAFRDEFSKRWPKTRGGGSAKWRERLNQLAVMRIWKYEGDQWERLKLMAKFSGYKGCKKRSQNIRGAAMRDAGMNQWATWQRWR